MGYPSPPGDEIAQLIAEIGSLKHRVAELERPTGTQTANAVGQLRLLVNSLQEEIDNLLAVAVNTGAVNATGNINAGGNVTATGTLTAAAGISSIGAYSTDVTLLPGSRVDTWQHSSGVFGQTVSTIVKKINLGEVSFSAADVLACAPFVFEYVGQVDIRDNPDNPYFDPSYEVPLEIGFMAEHLIAAGLSIFVYYEQDGITPRGINYPLFGAVANMVVVRNHEERIAALEATV